MQHDGFLILIFVVLGLVVPGVVFLRVYSTAFSGLDKSSKAAQAAREQASREKNES